MKKILILLMVVGSLTAMSKDNSEQTVKLSSNLISSLNMSRANCEDKASIDIRLATGLSLKLEYSFGSYTYCDKKIENSNNNADLAFATLADIYHGDPVVNSDGSTVYCQKLVGYLIYDKATGKARNLTTKLIAAKCP